MRGECPGGGRGGPDARHRGGGGAARWPWVGPFAAVVAAVAIAAAGSAGVEARGPYPTPDSSGVDLLLRDLYECTIPEDVTYAIRDVLLAGPPAMDRLGISGDGVTMYVTSDAFATGEATGDLSNELLPDSVAMELKLDGVDVGVVFAVFFEGEWVFEGAAGLTCLDTVRGLSGNERLLFDGRTSYGPTWIEIDGALQGIPECNGDREYPESTLGELQAVYIPCSGGDVSCGGGRLPVGPDTGEAANAPTRGGSRPGAIVGLALAAALAGLAMGRRVSRDPHARANRDDG